LITGQGIDRWFIDYGINAGLAHENVRRPARHQVHRPVLQAEEYSRKETSPRRAQKLKAQFFHKNSSTSRRLISKHKCEYLMEDLKLPLAIRIK
jgi:hypothetical protein